MSNKIDNIELRIVLIGEVGVGKKSIVKRFKMLTCTETKDYYKKNNTIIDVNNYHIHKKTKNETKEKDKNKDKENTNSNINNDENKKKDQMAESLKEEIERKKMIMRREEKRTELMSFCKIYKINTNNIELHFYPCIEAQPLAYDYEFREDDEFYEFEKENKITLKPLIKQLKHIILKQAENPNSQVEFIILFVFDLSNVNSFEKLLIYFSQIEKHFKLSNNFKIVLVGNKIDKKAIMSTEQKEGIDNLINQLNSKYYEISTLMFFPFEAFFEKLIIDNFSSLPILSSDDAKKTFHQILTQKNSFPKAIRETFETNDFPSPNRYNPNPYQYPEKRRQFLNIFHDPGKFNKKIFINKMGILFPPLKKEKEKEVSSFNKDKLLNEKKEIYTFETNKKVKEAIELVSRKPGHSFGIQTNKPLNLKYQRKVLSELRENELDRFLTEYTTPLYQQVKSSNKGELSQERYLKNRLEQQQKQSKQMQKIKEDLKKRHDDVILKNTIAENEKIMLANEKEKKYQKRYEDREKKRIRNQTLCIMKNNSESEIEKKFKEPKGKFYTPISCFDTKKGFTFGLKLNYKNVNQDSPDFPLFKDDFEKLLLKNKRVNFVKAKGKRFPDYKTDEVGDSSYIMEAQKKFEMNRNLIKKGKISSFIMDRKNKREDVKQRKKEILEIQENELKEQILKQYKSDNNYLIKEINYNQVEASSPKYSIREKYEFGSIFQYDKQNNDENSNQFGYSTLFNPDTSTKMSNTIFENPDFALIRPKYPVYSFSRSKRFSFTMNTFDKNKEKNKDKNIIKYSSTETNIPFHINKNKNKNKKNNDKDRNNSELNYFGYRDTQSFLKAQTFMGTGQRFNIKYNNSPGSNLYKIRRFADDVVMKGNEINLARMKVREKEKLEQSEKERRAVLREKWQEEKKYALKMSLKDHLMVNNMVNNINNNSNNDLTL